ncbi:MAG: L-amino acid N-acyltransferase [Clostridia bacterium]|jgi:phosphinothricin acetyltransferase|nr:L-amino acid N-acyltransferase [Clostridia bacterium]MDN5324148.1 L-amino acid N-acyltransferase [Clostridia bacterium]
MIIRKAELKDLQAITDIYNHAILNLTATFDEEIKSLEERKEWYFAHQGSRYPLIVAELNAEIVGWGSISPFRPRAGYRFTGETSIYVRTDRQGHKIGTLLLKELIDMACASGLHTLMGIIVDDNLPSIKLHAKFGFEIVGRFKEAGYKFGRWLDVIIMQKML